MIKTALLPSAVTRVNAGALEGSIVAICPRVTTPAPAPADLIGMALRSLKSATLFSRRARYNLCRSSILPSPRTLFALPSAITTSLRLTPSDANFAGSTFTANSRGALPSISTPATPSTDVRAGRIFSSAIFRKATGSRLSDVSAYPTTGNNVGSDLRTSNFAPLGRSGSNVARAACVAKLASTISSPQEKFSATSALPRLVVDLMRVTPGTARNAISILRVISASICAASRSPASTDTTTRG